MDTLLAEINSKRKALTELDGAAGAGEPSKKYMRRADIERAKEEEERRKRAEAKAAEEAKSESSRAAKMRREAEMARKSAQRNGSPSSSAGATPEPTGQNAGTSAGETFNISNEECIRRLRSKGQPIRLFGETDKERRLRLRALELLEKTSGSSSQGFNDFNKLMKDMESGYEAREEEKKSRAMHGQEGGSSGTGTGAGSEAAIAADEKREREAQRRKVADQVLDLDLIKSDPQKLYPIMYYVLKGVLKEWEDWMEARPEEIKRSTAGKLASATQASSAQNLKPLFKTIRSRDMADDVLRCMSEIVHHMQKRQYQKANDAYLRLSIGNAAWPIGVTSVGIHERSSREKIAEDVVGHVLNDEVSRKWIQAVKRLLTFSQTIRPPHDLSQMMG